MKGYVDIAKLRGEITMVAEAMAKDAGMTGVSVVVHVEQAPGEPRKLLIHVDDRQRNPDDFALRPEYWAEHGN